MTAGTEHDRHIAVDLRMVWCDALDFARMLDLAASCGRDEERTRFTARALALYRGDFLAGDSREEWIVCARAGLRARYVLACTAQGERFSAAGEGQALAAYRRERLAESDAERKTNESRDLMQLRRTDYLEAHRRVEVVKRLELKSRAVHRDDCNREEQAGFDEFAGRRAAGRGAVFST